MCDSISGEEGCAIATKDDIEVLLLGLKSPCTAVRDSALQVLDLVEIFCSKHFENHSVEINFERAV